MADININDLVKQAEAAGAAKDKSTGAPQPKLKPGQYVVQEINIFGIDKTLPSGFVNVVYNRDGSQDGYVKNGKVAPLFIQEEGQSIGEYPISKGAPKQNDNQSKINSVASFQYAKHLEGVAAQEYQDLQAKAEIISRGASNPGDKQALEQAAKNYQSTITAIQSAYEKSGVVQGSVNLDVTGKLKEGTTYIDPTQPQATLQVVQPGGKTSAPAPNQSALGTTDEQSVRIANTLATNADAAAQQAVKDAASVSNVTNNMVNSGLKAAGGTPVSTPVSTPTDTSAGAGSGSAGTSTGGGDYKTVKGVLNYQGNPFTGRYQGIYYAEGKVETTDQIKQDFIAKYGQQAKFIMSVPELGGPGGLLDQAIKTNMAPAAFTAAFQNTTWAQTHPGDAGLAEIKRVSTPELYNKDYNTAYDRVQGLASQLGVTLTPQQLGQKVADNSLQTVQNVDQNAVNNGQDITNWVLQNPTASDAQITKRLAQYAAIDPNAQGGALKAQSVALQQLAQQYGVYGQYSPDGKSTDFFDKQALGIAQGTSDQNTLENQFRTSAMNTYKPFADQIKAGAKVSDLASPYVNSLSSLLEVSPADVQLGAASGYGAMVSKAMVGDANGTPTNLYDFANQVRSQPQWLNTQNAHTTILGGIDQLINKMGLG
jgi:hypothetical protein